MVRRALSVLSVGWLLLLAWTPAAAAFHDDDCNTRDDHCSDGWKVPEVVNPFWWRTSEFYGHDPFTGINNQPAYFHLTSAHSVHDPFVVGMTVTGAVVGSLDAFIVQRSTTSDRVTPDCPQGFLDYLLPNNGSPGSPGHVNRVDRLVRKFHKTVLPVDLSEDPENLDSMKNTVSIELPRGEDWILVFDARAGTNHLDDQEATPEETRVDYEISVSNGEFDAEKIDPAPDRPFDATIWSGNANACLPP